MARLVRTQEMRPQARGEPFDEPEPGSEEAIRRKREALESSFLYRLQHHWVWPHIMVLFVVCLVIDAGRPRIRDRVASEVHCGHRRKRHGVHDNGGILAGGRSVLAPVQVLQVVLPVECDGNNRRIRDISELDPERGTRASFSRPSSPHGTVRLRHSLAPQFACSSLKPASPPLL